VACRHACGRTRRRAARRRPKSRDSKPRALGRGLATPQSVERLTADANEMRRPAQTCCASPSIAVGIDLVRVSQIEDSVKRFGRRFLERVYTARELSYSLADVGSVAPRLAARFAAKEAAMKVLRVGGSGMSWRSIEVLRAPDGWCELALHDDAKKRADDRGLCGFSVSLSHEGDYATAMVIAERG
jgi:holo-[acyl-carrier protein] synthase